MAWGGYQGEKLTKKARQTEKKKEEKDEAEDTHA